MTSIAETNELQALFDAGAHLGYSKSRRHPKMQPYIFGVRNNIEVFDLETALRKLGEAEEFIYNLGREGRGVIWVGAKPAAQKSIREAGTRLGLPYIAERWIGGTLTNFKVVDERLKYWARLEAEARSPEFERYSKKERLMKTIELKKLERIFGGIKNLKSLPAALIIVDPKKEKTAFREAQRKKIPVIAVLNSDCNPEGVAYPIPANDNSALAIDLILDKLVSAYEKGIKEAANSKQQIANG